MHRPSTPAKESSVFEIARLYLHVLKVNSFLSMKRQGVFLVHLYYYFVLDFLGKALNTR